MLYLFWVLSRNEVAELNYFLKSLLSILFLILLMKVFSNRRTFIPCSGRGCDRNSQELQYTAISKRGDSKLPQGGELRSGPHLPSGPPAECIRADGTSGSFTLASYCYSICGNSQSLLQSTLQTLINCAVKGQSETDEQMIFFFRIKSYYELESQSLNGIYRLGKNWVLSFTFGILVKKS